MKQKKLRKLPKGIYPHSKGGYEGKINIGEGARRFFPEGTSDAEMEQWAEDTRHRLKKDRRIQGGVGTLRADSLRYLASTDAALSKSTKKRRTQQFDWWCAQPAALEADVILPENLGTHRLPPDTLTLGQMRRRDLNPARLREILAIAFKPTDPSDPNEFASTSNHYRKALVRMFNVLDMVTPEAPNPLRGVKARAEPAKKPRAQDVRVVAEILKQAEHAHFIDSDLRLAVLAWVHITPDQLKRLDMPTCFRDVPDASFEDICNGVITLTKGPRFKGRKGKTIPLPETIALNPWGVRAMREYAKHPEVWGKFSAHSLNKKVKRSAKKAQAALAKRGVTVDLSEFTLYCLKHSLATAATLASHGIVGEDGKIQQVKGVSKALDHTSTRTTAVYTEAAVDPLVREVNRLTSLWLKKKFEEPLTAPTSLRLVSNGSNNQPPAK